MVDTAKTDVGFFDVHIDCIAFHFRKRIADNTVSDEESAAKGVIELHMVEYLADFDGFFHERPVPPVDVTFLLNGKSSNGFDVVLVDDLVSPVRRRAKKTLDVVARRLVLSAFQF